MVNIFDDFISTKSPLKISRLPEYKDTFNKIVGDAKKIIRDIKDIDPEKAEYYAALLLRPNPYKIYRPPAGEKSYEQLASEIVNYPTTLPELTELPFKGRKSLQGYSLDNSVYWDVRMEAYSPKVPKNPFSDGWFPLTRIEVSLSKVESEVFNLVNQITISIPKYNITVPRINVTCVDNEDSILRNYFVKYMSIIYPKDKTVLPYKDSLSKLTFYVFDLKKKIKFKKSYLVYPKYDFKISGSEGDALVFIDLEYEVVGELL